MAKLPDPTEYPQGVQSRIERLLRGKRRIPRAQLSHERRFPRVGRLRRVPTSAVFGEENEKGSRRGFQKRLEGKYFLKNGFNILRIKLRGISQAYRSFSV